MQEIIHTLKVQIIKFFLLYCLVRQFKFGSRPRAIFKVDSANISLVISAPGQRFNDSTSDKKNVDKKYD